MNLDWDWPELPPAAESAPNAASTSLANLGLILEGQKKLKAGGVLRQLVRRGLIAVTQRGEAGQREVKYGTTARFLELFGLKSLDDLPQTQDLQKL